MFWRGIFVLLLGCVIGGVHCNHTLEVSWFNMTGVNKNFSDPNSYLDVDALHCPLGPDEYVVCPAKEADEVCICSHGSNMTVYNRHLCLQRPTSRENVDLPKSRIIYLRIKHQNIISIKNELLPELAKPLIELNVTNAERSVVLLQCMSDPDQLFVAYSVSVHDLNRKFDVVAWKDIFIETLSEGGKLEVIDVGVISHYHEFHRFMKSVMIEGNPSAHQTKKLILLAVGILGFFIILLAIAYVFKWLHKTEGAFFR